MGTGRAYIGTSGFAYPAWAPRFYPAGLSGPRLLPWYAARLPAVELNNTFYRRPSHAAVAAWTGAVGSDFRFTVKAQRGSAFRLLRGPDPREAIAWLLPTYEPFGDRLGCVLLGVDDRMAVDLPALERFLEAWPAAIALAIEFGHPSWELDEVHGVLRDAGVAVVATDRDGSQEPVLRRIGPFLYLRLRRLTMREADVDAWADRLRPFLDDGIDCFCFLRHDADGTSALLAQRLLARVAGGAPG
jgi:uncharacterized protein YecE (DUF72 family)